MSKSNEQKKLLNDLINAVRQFVGDDAEIFVGKDLVSPKFTGVIIDNDEPLLVGDPLFSGQTYLVIQANLPTKLETGLHKI